jgi:hypothetical protein
VLRLQHCTTMPDMKFTCVLNYLDQSLCAISIK